MNSSIIRDELLLLMHVCAAQWRTCDKKPLSTIFVDERPCYEYWLATHTAINKQIITLYVHTNS